ncbi:hypothetical protein FC35_GL001637 [Limosilactobacillus coleohominis DSM 14060]|nr:hypothetical protein FC35_GL001637 [Limosilactobacillus coleohominis DSM 14060]
MKIKIETQQIGLKTPISVIVNLPLVDRAAEMMENITKFQITALKAEQMNEKDNTDLEMAEANLNATQQMREISKSCVAFLKDVLKLNSKQVQTLQHTIYTQNSLLKYTGYVCGRLQYADATPAKQESIPKSPSDSSEDNSTN